MKRAPVLPSRAEQFISGAPDAPAAPAPAVTAPPATEPAAKPKKPREKAAKPAPKQEEVAPPWEGVEGNTPYSIRWPNKLYRQMEWAKLYVPGPENSIQKLVVAGMTEYMEKLVKQHWKGKK